MPTVRPQDKEFDGLDVVLSVWMARIEPTYRRLSMTRTALAICMILLLAPMYFMLTGSLQDINGVFIMPPRIIPKHVDLTNYTELIKASAFGRWAANTLIVVALTVAASVAVSSMAGFSFAFYRFKGQKAVYLLLLAGIMVPRISVIVPLFVVMNRIGLNGTLAGVILPTVLSPVGLYLATEFFKTVPIAMLDSARIDGATDWQVLFHVVAPISRPIITALGLFAGIAALQDYVWQMLVLQSRKSHTLLVGLVRTVMLRGGDSAMNVNPIGKALAAGVLLLIPLLAIFAVANKYFTTAIGGAVKG